MDEIHKIILETVNAEKVDQLVEKIRQEQALILELNGLLQQGKMSQAQYEQSTLTTAGSIKAMNDELVKLRGTKSNTGMGLLGASYGLQDIITVLSMGGGWDRALMSATNNISPMLSALGKGAGLAGVAGLVVTAFAAAIPIVKSFFAEVGGETAEKAKKQLEEIEQRVKGIHEAFLKLQNAPTEIEREATGALVKVLSERPTAARAKEAMARAMSAEEAMTAEGMTTKFGALPTDAQLEQQATREATDPEGAVNPATYRRILERLQRERAQRRGELLREARRQRAEEIIADSKTGATVAGPAGEHSRELLRQLTRGVPGLEQIQAATPEMMRLQEEARQAEEERQATRKKDAAAKKQADAEMERQRKQIQDRAQQTAEQADRKRQADELKFANEAWAHEDKLALQQEQQEAFQKRDVLRTQRADEQAQRAMPRIFARQRAGAAFQQQTGMQADSEMLDAMAAETMRHMAEGMSKQAATWAAVMSMMQRINRASAELDRQAGAMRQHTQNLLTNGLQ